MSKRTSSAKPLTRDELRRDAESLSSMLAAITRDAEDYLRCGRFRARSTLPSGAVATVEIRRSKRTERPSPKEGK